MDRRRIGDQFLLDSWFAGHDASLVLTGGTGRFFGHLGAGHRRGGPHLRGRAMVLVPGRFIKQASGTETLLMRTVGIRDVVIGSGACAALAGGAGVEFRRWASMGLLSDSADVVAGLTSSRSLPDTRSALIAMLSPVPFVAAGIFGLARGAKKL